MVDTAEPSVVIPRQMLQDVLAEHLTKQVFETPEQRDELIRSLIRSVLDSKEYSHDKMTYVEKFIRLGIAEKVKEIAGEWVDANRAIIEAQVNEALQTNIVKAIVADMATAIGDRIKRTY